MTIKIKKYNNRKLYDTEKSRYINNVDILNYLREGKDVQVVAMEKDIATQEVSEGKDVTQHQLASLAYSVMKRQPVDNLKALIGQLNG